MPAPGPKDGHASKASRDLGGRRGLTREIKNVSVKSNGFKGGGQGGVATTNRGLAGVRLGEGGSARSVAARQRLRARFLAGEAGKAAKAARTVGRKRAREAAAAATAPTTTTTTAAAAADARAVEGDVVEAKSDDAHVAGSENDYFCDVCACKCGSRNNYETHVASKRHRQNRDAARGREILASLKRQRVEISGEA
jgi:hypothetical protein